MHGFVVVVMVSDEETMLVVVQSYLLSTKWTNRKFYKMKFWVKLKYNVLFVICIINYFMTNTIELYIFKFAVV